MNRLCAFVRQPSLPSTPHLVTTSNLFVRYRLYVVDHLVTANICMSLILTHSYMGSKGMEIHIKEITQILLLIKIISIVGVCPNQHESFSCVYHLPI